MKKDRQENLLRVYQIKLPLEIPAEDSHDAGCKVVNINKYMANRNLNNPTTCETNLAPSQTEPNRLLPFCDHERNLILARITEAGQKLNW